MTCLRQSKPCHKGLSRQLFKDRVQEVLLQYVAFNGLLNELSMMTILVLHGQVEILNAESFQDWYKRIIWFIDLSPR